MTAATVNRRDILVSEEREYESSLTGEERTTITWVAGLSGPLSTGEHVTLTRTGGTFTEALANLEAAITDNGWEIK